MSMTTEKETESRIAEELARVASRFQEQRTGHAPKAVTVVLSEDTLVVTFHEALTPAERALAKSPAGAAQVQEFHRQLFANSTADMRREIERITGRPPRSKWRREPSSTRLRRAPWCKYFCSPQPCSLAQAVMVSRSTAPAGRKTTDSMGRKAPVIQDDSVPRMTRRMVKMAAFFCSGESASTEVARSDASRGKQLACQEELTQDRGSKIGRISGEQRVLRVLVIHDDPDTADKLVGLVSCCGHTARWAYDGATGLRVAASQHPDVVFLDLEMPFMDGCEVARQLRLDFPRTECFIIGVTGWAGERCRRQSSEAGIDLVLLKPIEPSLMETLLMVECRRANRRSRLLEEANA